MKLDGQIVNIEINPKTLHGKIGDPDVYVKDWEITFVVKITVPREKFVQMNLDPISNIYSGGTVPVTLTIQAFDDEATDILLS